jgi:hypothetical protein
MMLDIIFNVLATCVHFAAIITGFIVLHVYSDLFQGVSTARTLNFLRFFRDYTHRRLWILVITMPVSLYFMPFSILSFRLVENNQEFVILGLLFGFVALAYHLDAIQDRRRRV